MKHIVKFCIDVLANKVPRDRFDICYRESDIEIYYGTGSNLAVIDLVFNKIYAFKVIKADPGVNIDFC